VWLHLPPRVMAEKDWSPSTVMLGHLQKLMKQGFIMAVLLTTCHVLEDPVFPMPTEGYVVSFMMFYEQGFGMSSYRFLCSLLQHYNFEQHHLTLSGVLQIVAFMTLCEVYMGIDPEFDLWNYFFRVRHPLDLEVELTVSEGAVIHVRSGHRVDPYLKIPVPRLMKGWWKKWFYLRNDASTLLPVFIDSHPVPLPSWGDDLVGKDLGKLQPLHEALQ
jgi:hypothetical protein